MGPTTAAADAAIARGLCRAGEGRWRPMDTTRLAGDRRVAQYAYEAACEDWRSARGEIRVGAWLAMMRAYLRVVDARAAEWDAKRKVGA